MTLLSRLEGAAEGSRDLDASVERLAATCRDWTEAEARAANAINYVSTADLIAALTALSTRDAELAAAREALKPDSRYPFVFHDRATWGRVGVSFAQDTDYIQITMLRENKPGGAWDVVEMTPDEAEKFALRTLERARTAKQALGASNEPR